MRSKRLRQVAEKSFVVEALFWKRMSKELSKLAAFIKIKKYVYTVLKYND